MAQQDDIAKKNKTIDPDEPKTARRFANGDEILGRYVVQSELGQGGMGVVYRCFDKIGGVEVAVKGLPPEVSHSSDEMEMVRENFQLVSELHHQNIAGVRTLEKDSTTGDYYLVMTLARGVSLRHWLRQHGGKEHRAEQLNVLRQIASALDYAHNAEPKHIIHRDVKLENIMVDDGGHVMVLDFGLAAQVRSSLSRVSQVVTSRSGTPAYKSPEQWLAQAQRAPSDQYSLGVIAYQMFAGELPFDSDDIEILKHAVVFDPVPGIADEKESVNAVFAKVLAKKPCERFGSCEEFVRYVSAASRGEIRFKAASTCHLNQGRPKRNLKVTLSYWVAVLAVLVAIFTWRWLKSENALPSRGRITERPTKVLQSQAAGDNNVVPNTNASLSREKDNLVVSDQLDRRSLISDIRIEAKVKVEACRRIADGDGFKALKGACEDVFVRGEAAYEQGNWELAAQSYSNLVNRVVEIIRLDECRQQVVATKCKLDAARGSAIEAGAKELAKTRFGDAEKASKQGVKEFAALKFPAAQISYGMAIELFNDATQDAANEKNRQKLAEKAEKERQKAAEQERQRILEDRRRARIRKEGRDFMIELQEADGFAMKMCWLSRGDFMMGSPDSENGRFSDERYHRVEIDSGFWMSEREVTQDQWKMVMHGEGVRDLVRKGILDDTTYFLDGKNQTLREHWQLSRSDSSDKKCGLISGDSPVYAMTWFEANRFCQRLTALERRNGSISEAYEYRIPREREWEYACKKIANDLTPSCCALKSMLDGVGEWCADVYGLDEEQGKQRGAFRVFKGGCPNLGSRYLRPAFRGALQPGVRSTAIGFRVVLVRKEGN